MKKKVINRILFGFPIGVFINYTITIIISLILKKGYYYPVVPTLIEECGSQINAVIVQFVLSGILGISFSIGSLVWENENLDILKQSVIHFFITSFSMFPIAYFTRWMEHTFRGIIIYFTTFIVIYIIIWLVKYNVWKSRIKAINNKIKKS